MNEEKINQLATKITNKIIVFAINNKLLDKDTDTIIDLYKKSVKEEK